MCRVGNRDKQEPFVFTRSLVVSPLFDITIYTISVRTILHFRILVNPYSREVLRARANNQLATRAMPDSRAASIAAEKHGKRALGSRGAVYSEYGIRRSAIWKLQGEFAS